jgi:MYXO-CTERM domain-containing protein
VDTSQLIADAAFADLNGCSGHRITQSGPCSIRNGQKSINLQLSLELPPERGRLMAFRIEKRAESEGKKRERTHMSEFSCMRCIAAAAVAASALTTAASADLVAIAGDSANSAEGLGDFVGSVEYTSIGGDAGTLIISLTNTSDPANGGFITGFLFNIDSTDPGVIAELVSGDYPFDQCDGNGLNGQPFGNPYDAGAALGGNFEGGGNPSNGIGVGDTGTFTFAIIADDAGSLSGNDFLNGPYEFDFIVRFRGFEDGGSDKVPVPAPGALALLALAGLTAGRRRR